jgi:hypothetical protein
MAYELGWSNFKNGALLDAAERQGYEVLNNHRSGAAISAKLAGQKHCYSGIAIHRLASNPETDPCCAAGR